MVHTAYYYVSSSYYIWVLLLCVLILLYPHIYTCSMIGSAAGTLWSTPCEVVKCTFQSGMYTTSVKSAVRSIHKEAGLRGFYQVIKVIKAL